ncbi:hypothetical protein D3C85_1615090 [compost metagenome]
MPLRLVMMLRFLYLNYVIIKKSVPNSHFSCVLSLVARGVHSHATHPLLYLLLAEDLGQHPIDAHAPVRQHQIEGALELGGIEP